MTKIQKQCLFLILGIASAKIRFPRQLQEKGTISIKNLGTVINLFVNLTLTFLGIIGVTILLPGYIRSKSFAGTYA